MTDFPRLIEHAFPLKQTSLDSVHEKNARHGHIPTMHILPARRRLAMLRAIQSLWQNNVALMMEEDAA